MSFNHVKHLQQTCEHMASCLPDTKFYKTKNGGFFKKGNRTLGAVVSPKQKDDMDSSFKINKWKNGYGLNIHPNDTGMYTFLKESVSRGLRIK